MLLFMVLHRKRDMKRVWQCRISNLAQKKKDGFPEHQVHEYPEPPPPPRCPQPRRAIQMRPEPTQPVTTSGCKRWHKVASGNTCDAIVKQYGITSANPTFTGGIQTSARIEDRCGLITMFALVCKSDYPRKRVGRYIEHVEVVVRSVLGI
jgi:hypothetical protein